MDNVIGLVMMIAVAALLAWSSIRAWRAKNNFVKWSGASLAALLTAAVSLASALTIAGLFKLYTRNAPVPELKAAGTPEQIQRGQAIADSFCGGCPPKNTPPPRAPHTPNPLPTSPRPLTPPHPPPPRHTTP